MLTYEQSVASKVAFDELHGFPVTDEQMIDVEAAS